MNNLLDQKTYTKLFWGFILVMISFKLNNFDILPDFIGYLLFALAFKSLEEKSSYFKAAFNLNIPLLVMSAFGIFMPSGSITNNNLGNYIFILLPYSMIMIFLQLTMMYNFFMGLKTISDSASEIELSSTVMEKWKQYKILQILNIGAYFTIFLVPVFIALVLITFVFTIVLLIGILNTLKLFSEKIV